MDEDPGDRSRWVCVCGHDIGEHFEGCCFVKGCYEITGRAPCYQTSTDE